MMIDKTEQDIMKKWTSKESQSPVVSVCCATFNQEKFICETINGFLIQETDFPFEIIIRDDCSTDKTASIVKDYVAKYPHLIKPIYEKENQYSKGGSAIVSFSKQARGSYIALCEGDDYWTDCNKLQIQVDFLERNTEYIVSGHDAYVIDENGKRVKDSKLPDRYKKDFTGDDLIIQNTWILTMSMVFRNVIQDGLPLEFNMVINRDTFLMSLLGNYGKSKYHSEINPACYRVHSGGVWSRLTEQERLDSTLNTIFWLYRYYTRMGKDEYGQYFLEKYHRKAISRIKIKVIIKELLIRVFYFWK